MKCSPTTWKVEMKKKHEHRIYNRKHKVKWQKCTNASMTFLSVTILNSLWKDKDSWIELKKKSKTVCFFIRESKSRVTQKDWKCCEGKSAPGKPAGRRQTMQAIMALGKMDFTQKRSVLFEKIYWQILLILINTTYWSIFNLLINLAFVLVCA